MIIEIILNDKDVLLGCQKIVNLGFDNHLHAYVVEDDNFLFIKSINWTYTKTSYIFLANDNRKLVKWD